MFVEIDEYVINVEMIDYIYHSQTGRAYFVRVRDSVVEINEKQGEVLLHYIHNKKGITILDEGD